MSFGALNSLYSVLVLLMLFPVQVMAQEPTLLDWLGREILKDESLGRRCVLGENFYVNIAACTVETGANADASTLSENFSGKMRGEADAFLGAFNGKGNLEKIFHAQKKTFEIAESYSIKMRTVYVGLTNIRLPSYEGAACRKAYVKGITFGGSFNLVIKLRAKNEIHFEKLKWDYQLDGLWGLLKKSGQNEEEKNSQALELEVDVIPIQQGGDIGQLHELMASVNAIKCQTEKSLDNCGAYIDLLLNYAKNSIASQFEWKLNSSDPSLRLKKLQILKIHTSED